MNNTRLWDALGKTNPEHTKPFTRAGGFKGTAIKPMFSYRRMTEEFGPCGTGWGIGKPEFQVVNAGEEVLVYCTVSIWYTDAKITGSEIESVFGVGGDKVLSKTQSGLRTDDEAFKKAFTDAVTNALKLIGVGADVHMGMFDDSKYVNDMRAEFEQEAKPEAPKPKSSARLKRERSWEQVVDDLERDMADVGSLVSFERVKQHYRELVKKEGWPQAWIYQLKDKLEAYENQLRDTVSDIQDQFPGAKITNERMEAAE